MLTDIYRPVAVGAQADPPSHCGAPTVWIPAVGAVDAFEPGQEFTVYDGQNRPVRIESFRQMHQLEAQSERQARNGEGQPMRFRMLHQYRSNREVNTFGPDPAERPDPASLRRFRPMPMQEEPAYGPGVSDATTSGLAK